VNIREIIRSATNEEKLAAHGISWAEIVEMVDSDSWVPTSHPDYPEQVRIVGRTRTGRWLTIVLDPSEEPDTWRPVTGWVSDRHEIDYYLEEL
jgi:hypothetical protein